MPVISTLDNTLGLLYDAVLISSALYGAGCLQAWFYFRKYSQRDAWPIKATVGFILLCDTIQMTLLSASVYKYTVTFHGDNTALNIMEKFASPSAPAITRADVLLQNASHRAVLQRRYRISDSDVLLVAYFVSKSWFLAGSVALLGWTSYLILFVYTIIVLKYEFLTDLLEQVPMSTTLNAFGAACDLAITVIMVLYLEKSKTGFRKSTDMINRLIIFTFNTGIPTTICALMSLICLNAIPSTFLYIFFYLIMGRFYTNSILVTLNSRDYIRDGRRSEGSASNDISMNGFGTTGAFGNSGGRGIANPRTGPQEISIRIDTNHHQEAGMYSKEYPEEHRSGKPVAV
ncbi:hypothetical protein CPB85DRAFT_1435440 [Mucidula mucida]|nr:hypothetical protein CPB85DRAFT_1435440 [Mucidula mucida]